MVVPMTSPVQFTVEEIGLLTDDQFFRKKATIMGKMRGLLDATHEALAAELREIALVTPSGFDPDKSQFVKGEHLEDFPYQYLDYPKHFAGDEKFTYRTLFWWGHALVFAMLLDGPLIKRYKKNLVDRYHQVAGRELHLSLAPTLWEWKHGEGYTLPVAHDRKAQVAAVLAERPFMKIVRVVPLDDARVKTGLVADLARETFRALTPIVGR